MSVEAVSWAIRQTGLRPVEKLVLLLLGDAHNRHTGRCDPSQERLARDAEIHRATLNRTLDRLEELGLIRRQKRSNQRTKRQITTAYRLALDTTIPCRKMRHGDVEPVSHASDAGRVAEPAEAVSQPSDTTLTPEGEPEAKPKDRPKHWGKKRPSQKPRAAEHGKPGKSVTGEKPMTLFQVEPGSSAANDWDTWLADRGFPCLQQVAGVASGGTGWLVPDTYPPRSDDDQVIRVKTEHWLGHRLALLQHNDSGCRDAA